MGRHHEKSIGGNGTVGPDGLASEFHQHFTRILEILAATRRRSSGGRDRRLAVEIDSYGSVLREPTLPLECGWGRSHFFVGNKEPAPGSKVCAFVVPWHNVLIAIAELDAPPGAYLLQHARCCQLLVCLLYKGLREVPRRSLPALRAVSGCLAREPEQG
jgi:hypothetical protein